MSLLRSVCALFALLGKVFARAGSWVFRGPGAAGSVIFCRKLPAAPVSGRWFINRVVWVPHFVSCLRQRGNAAERSRRVGGLKVAGPEIQCRVKVWVATLGGLRLLSGAQCRVKVQGVVLSFGLRRPKLAAALVGGSSRRLRQPSAAEALDTVKVCPWNMEGANFWSWKDQKLRTLLRKVINQVYQAFGTASQLPSLWLDGLSVWESGKFGPNLVKIGQKCL